MKKQGYFCLNCNTPILFETDSNYITTCEKCAWRNELNDTPAIVPIILKSKDLENFTTQICYPLLDKELLKYLPEKLRNAVETYLKNPEQLTKEEYQNIYHNIYEKNLEKLDKRKRVLDTRIEFVKFFKTTNFLR